MVNNYNKDVKHRQLCKNIFYNKRILHILSQHWGLPGGTGVKKLPANAGDSGDVGSISMSGRAHGVAKSQT